MKYVAGTNLDNLKNHEVRVATDDLTIVREIMVGLIELLNYYKLFESHVLDSGLRAIIKRQYNFIQKEYAQTLACLRTGAAPLQKHDYEMTELTPKKISKNPATEFKEFKNKIGISDEWICKKILEITRKELELRTGATIALVKPIYQIIFAKSVPNYMAMACELAIYQSAHNYNQHISEVEKLTKSERKRVDIFLHFSAKKDNLAKKVSQNIINSDPNEHSFITSSGWVARWKKA